MQTKSRIHLVLYNYAMKLIDSDSRLLNVHKGIVKKKNCSTVSSLYLIKNCFTLSIYKKNRSLNKVL